MGKIKPGPRGFSVERQAKEGVSRQESRQARLKALENSWTLPSSPPRLSGSTASLSAQRQSWEKELALQVSAN